MFGEQPPLGNQELSSGINLMTQNTCLEARSLLIPSGEILLCLYCSMGSGGCRVFSVFWKQTFSCALPHSPSLNMEILCSFYDVSSMKVLNSHVHSICSATISADIYHGHDYNSVTIYEKVSNKKGQ